MQLFLNMVWTEGISHLMVLMALLLPLPSAPGQAVAAAEGHGGGAESTPGGDCQNGGQAVRADSAAGAGEPAVCCPGQPSCLGVGRVTCPLEVHGLEPVDTVCLPSVSGPRSDGGQQQSSLKWNHCSTRWRSSGES